jgi:hypothetical protein
MYSKLSTCFFFDLPDFVYTGFQFLKNIVRKDLINLPTFIPDFVLIF